MAKFPRNLRARPGKPIPKTWRALESWVDNYGLGRSALIKLTELPDETLAFVRKSGTSWPHPWRASVTGPSVVLEPGLVNLTMPRVGEDLITLDGIDDQGKQTSERPEVVIDEDPEKGPGADGRSFVCVRVEVDPESGEVTKDARPLEWLTVVHRRELPTGFESGTMPEVIEGEFSVGYFPVAILYWRDTDAVERLLQPVHHHLQHEWFPGGEDAEGGKKPNRHVFHP